MASYDVRLESDTITGRDDELWQARIKQIPLVMTGTSGPAVDFGGLSIMDGVADRGAPPGSHYADQRPYAVADRLDDLRGPTAGVVQLDRRLDWSGRACYDLDNPRRVASMYETVLREATTPEDLIQWLDKPTLVRLWPALVLPRQIRQMWEARLPELINTGRLAA